jgi:hypothetical protein
MSDNISHVCIQYLDGHREYITPEKCISGFALIDMRQGYIYTDYNIHFNNQPSLKATDLRPCHTHPRPRIHNARERLRVIVRGLVKAVRICVTALICNQLRYSDRKPHDNDKSKQYIRSPRQERDRIGSALEGGYDPRRSYIYSNS